MAQWRPMSYKTEQTITNLGGGINTGMPALSIDDSEMSYMRNMDSKDSPAISVRPGRFSYEGLVQSTAVNAFGSVRNVQAMIVSGNTWRYYTVFPTTLGGFIITITTALSTTDSDGNIPYGTFVELETGTTSRIVYMNSTQKYILAYPSTIVAISDTNCPVTNIVKSYKGRIYSASVKTLYYSALNDAADWTTANNAGNIVVVNATGVITALEEYNNYLIIFAQNSMHILYGTGPDTYQIIDLEGAVGCASNRSIAKCLGKIYWVGRDGIYEYSGTTPVRISDPVKQYTDLLTANNITLASADSIDKYVYFSVPYNTSTSNNIILKYDVVLKKWFVEEGNFPYFKRINNTLYGIQNDGQVMNMRSTHLTDVLTTDQTATPISWSFITKPFTDGAFSKDKVLSEINVVANVSTASTSFSIGYSTSIENNDSTTFTGSTIAGSSDPYVLFTTNAGSTNTQARRIQVPANKLQNVPWYRLRFAGTGPVTVNFMEKYLRVKRR